MPDTSGRLLVAEPLLGDPNFDRTVVLVVQHAAEGAFGLVLDRPADVPLAEVLPGWADLAGADVPLHHGGPVEPASGWCLARLADDAPAEGVTAVVGDLALVDLAGDPDRVAGHVRALRCYAGYAGWGPGQLDAELLGGSWIVADARPEDPFHPDPAALWRRVLARQEGRVARLALFPPDPSHN